MSSFFGGIGDISQLVADLAQEWNAGGTVFTAIKMNVTDLASHADSLLLDLQVDGVSQFRVDKNGIPFSVNGVLLSDMIDTWDNAGTVFTSIKMDVTNTASAALSKLINLLIGGVSYFSVDKDHFTYVKLLEFTDSPAVIRSLSGTWYLENSGQSISGASPFIKAYGNQPFQFGVENAVRWQIDAATFHFTPGAHASYDIGVTGTRPRNLYLSGFIEAGLPTADPTVAGRLWNDAGTVKVSAG